MDDKLLIEGQNKPLIRLVPLHGKYGVKFTIQQTAGTYRSFDYNFFER